MSYLCARCNCMQEPPVCRHVYEPPVYKITCIHRGAASLIMLTDYVTGTCVQEPHMLKRHLYLYMLEPLIFFV